MRNDNPWQIQSSQIVYENPWMRIHEDKVIMPSGKPGMYAYPESKDSVVIVAINAKKEMCIIRQFTYPAAVWSWRVPQGGGGGEDDLQAAKRELKEETGVEAVRWGRLGSFRVCNGFMTESCAVYLATGLTMSNERDLEEAIDDLQWIPMKQVDAKVGNGEIDDSQSIAAIHTAQKWMLHNTAQKRVNKGQGE